jgi:hypothetical protein
MRLTWISFNKFSIVAASIASVKRGKTWNCSWGDTTSGEAEADARDHGPDGKISV